MSKVSLILNWPKALTALIGILLIAGCQIKQSSAYCAIRILDAETGGGIPAIKLQSLNRASYISDSDGYIAFYEPGLMGREVYFEIDAEGYRVRSDVTGRMAVSLMVESGGSVEVQMERTQAAERLHRLTGQGIYRESILLGKSVPLREPLLNGDVLGQDSNLGVRYRSGIFWVWGDTFLPRAYQGNFSVSAATSLLPENGGLDPSVGIDYNYFADENGASRPMINIEGQGYTWFEWLVNIPDAAGEERLVGKYARVGGLWQNYERGIAVFNDENEMFEKHSESEEWLDGFAIMNHPIHASTDGTPMFYLTSEFDFQRVDANLDSVASPGSYEAFTCLTEGARYDPTNPRLDRGVNGKLNYGWKPRSDGISCARQSELISNGHIDQREGWIQLHDILTDVPHSVRRGSIQWNEYRQKWILIAQGDAEYFGDILFSEADSPIGPWAYATVVAEHDYLFYNPVHHPFFDRGDTIFFEGTYTNFWNQGATKPYYDYNQLQYRLKLTTPDAMIPAPVYKLINGDLATSTDMRLSQRWDDVEFVAFYAYDRDHFPTEAIPVYKSFEGGVMTLTDAGSGQPFAYCLPTETDPGRHIIGQWESRLEGYEAIDAYLPINIEQSGGEYIASTQSRTFSIVDVSLSTDKLQIEIEQYDKRYRLACNPQSQTPGLILGEWIKLDSDGEPTAWKGVWEATLMTDTWLPRLSKGLRSLLSDGSVTDKNENNAIGRVWANPHDQLFLDLSIQPIDTP